MLLNKKKYRYFLKKSIKVFIALLTLLIVYPSKVNAECFGRSPYADHVYNCYENCISFEYGGGLIWSHNYVCVNCHTDEFGYYCDKMYQLCTTGCSGSGGGGGWCTSGVASWECKKADNACNRPTPDGDFCGYDNNGLPKYMCKFCATPTCTAYFDTNTNYIEVGDTINSSLTVVPGVGTVTDVDFTLQSPGNVISINTASDSVSPYETSFTGISEGNATIVASVLMNGGVPRCAATAAVNVTGVGVTNSWWQVKDSDVQSMGDLTSMVPSLAGTYFSLAGDGGFPGVSSYAGTTNLTGANVSSTGWLANSAVTNARTYTYDYFANQIPTDILAIVNTVDITDVPGSLTSGSATHDTNDYYWYKYDGAVNSNQPLTIPATNIGGRKVILLVDNADVNITGNINLTDGQGFFLMIVKGSINIDAVVGGGSSPNLEGLYFADNMFIDGVGNTQLATRGSIVANGGISMQRDLDDNTPPSELFEYAPDQIMLFPKIIGIRKMNWKEVAP